MHSVFKLAETRNTKAAVAFLPGTNHQQGPRRQVLFGHHQFPRARHPVLRMDLQLGRRGQSVPFGDFQSLRVARNVLRGLEKRRRTGCTVPSRSARTSRIRPQSSGRSSSATLRLPHRSSRGVSALWKCLHSSGRTFSGPSARPTISGEAKKQRSNPFATFCRCYESTRHGRP